MSEPSTKLGKRLCALMSYDVKLTDWDRAAADFANEIRHEAIPWAHKALDEVGAPKGPDIAGRIRALAPHRDATSQEELDAAHRELDALWPATVKSATLAARIRSCVEELKRRQFALAEDMRATTAARDELRAIIVSAIKGNP